MREDAADLNDALAVATETIFDRSYEGSGSSEDDGRTVVLRAQLGPDQVLETLLATGGWRRLGEGIDRQSDGLCAVAWSGEDYLSSHREASEKAEIRGIVEREHSVVILSLLYC